MPLNVNARKLLEINSQKIRQNPEYKDMRIYVKDKQLFSDEHYSAIRLAGQHYRASILNGEYSAGTRELVFSFLEESENASQLLMSLVDGIHDDVFYNQKKSVSNNVIKCALMDEYLDDVLNNQIVVGEYIKTAAKTQPRHIWRFATPEEYMKYNVDIYETHYNGKVVAGYQVEKDVRYYEWLGDPKLTKAKEWIEKKFDTNFYKLGRFVKDYDAPVFLLAYERKGTKVEKAIICGTLDVNGDIKIGVEIPRDLFAKISKTSR